MSFVWGGELFFHPAHAYLEKVGIKHERCIYLYITTKQNTTKYIFVKR